MLRQILYSMLVLMFGCDLAGCSSKSNSTEEAASRTKLENKEFGTPSLSEFEKGGSTELTDHSHRYNVQVANKTNSTLNDVAVKFNDGTFDFTFGILGKGAEKTYSGIEGMPPVSSTATVSWRDEAGNHHSAIAKFPVNQVIGRGNLIIAVEGEKLATASFHAY